MRKAAQRSAVVPPTGQHLCLTSGQLRYLLAQRRSLLSVSEQNGGRTSWSGPAETSRHAETLPASDGLGGVDGRGGGEQISSFVLESVFAMLEITRVKIALFHVLIPRRDAECSFSSNRSPAAFKWRCSTQQVFLFFLFQMQSGSV